MALARLSGNDPPDMLHVPPMRAVRSGTGSGHGHSPENSQGLSGFLRSPSASPRGASSRLSKFRIMLIESHSQLLKQLDQGLLDLEKEGLSFDRRSPSTPTRGDSSIPLEPREQPRLLVSHDHRVADQRLEERAGSKPTTFGGTFQGRTLPAVLSDESGFDESELAEVEEEEGTTASTGLNGKKVRLQRQVTDTFTTLNDVDEKRKKNMVWIQKNARQSTFQETCEEFLPELTAMSRKQKQEAAKDAKKRFGETGAFVQFAPEHVESELARNAFARFSLMNENEEDAGPLGFFARIASHRWFERFSLLLTLSNVIYISFDVEFNYSGLVTRAAPGFIVAENLFCALFLLELMIRLLAYRRWIMALKDMAFLFDAILVAMMVVESWVMPLVDLAASGASSDVAETSSFLRIARVMRILRTARIAKLIRHVPELVILLKGMLTACRSVFFTLLLLVLVTYVFSVTITEVSRGTSLEHELFPGMWSSMLTLIVQCVMPDLEMKFKGAAMENWFVGMLWLLFIMFGTYIVMGLLVGILVETVKTVATYERKQLEIDFAQNVLWDLITETCADQDGDNRISQTEFAQLLARPETAKALTALGVDVSAALDYGHLLFEDGEPLTFAEFMEGMMTLRGTNQTTVKDMVDLRKFTAEEFSNLHAVLLDICTFLQSQGMTIDSLKAAKHSVRYSRASRMTQRVGRGF